MSIVLSFFRFFIYSFILLFIPVCVFYIFLGILGIYFVLFLYIFLVLGSYLFSDKFIQFYFPLSEKVQKNTEYSFLSLIEEICEEYPRLKNNKKPRMIIYQDPSPNMLIFKLPFRQGTFYLSQGMLTLLNEEEIRITLLCALQRYKDPQLYASSMCSVLTLIVILLSPKTWIQLILDSNAHINKKLDMWAALFFITLFPFLRALLTIGRHSAWRSQFVLPEFIEKKIQKDQAWWTYARRLGFSDLYIAEPIS